VSGRIGTALSLRLDHFHAAHVGPQHFGNYDAAVRLLVVLQDGDERADDRQPGAVECVDEARAATIRWAIADVRAARLEVPRVTARADFEPLLAAGRPQLDVELAAGGEAEITRDNLDAPVRDFQQRADRFCRL